MNEYRGKHSPSAPWAVSSSASSHYRSRHLRKNRRRRVLAVVGILGFTAAFAISSGAVIWVYISEVFPNSVRAKGQALGSFTHWFWCMIVSWTFPMVADRAGFWAFAFFALCMAAQLAWGLFGMPETKGGTIEDIERRLGIA